MTENRIYKPEEKLKVILEWMNGTISVADLCRKYDIKSERFYYWKDQITNSAAEIFESRGRKVDENRIILMNVKSIPIMLRNLPNTGRLCDIMYGYMRE
jgi:transposase-like protein